MSELDIYNYLATFITAKRKELIESTARLRTNYISIALEDVHHPQNISAVLRTCDCFGIQDLHIIENYKSYEVNPKVVRGSDRWISIHKYNQQQENTSSAIQTLRSKGFRIVATTPHTNDIELDKFNLEKGPAVFFFGTEQKGISTIVEQQADEFVKIPMFGFTESLNISVAAGILIHMLSTKLRNSTIQWQLKSNELQALQLHWMRQSVKRHDLLEQRFLTES